MLVYGDQALSHTVIFDWARCFPDGPLIIEDNCKDGPQVTTTDNQTIKAVENLIIEDRRIAIHQKAYALDISVSTVHHIIHDELQKEILVRYTAERDEFRFRIITGDQSFIHYCQPALKQSSKQWNLADSPPPTKLKQEKSVSKVLCSCLCDHNEINPKLPAPQCMTVTKTFCKCPRY